MGEGVSFAVLAALAATATGLQVDAQQKAKAERDAARKRKEARRGASATQAEEQKVRRAAQDAIRATREAQAAGADIQVPEDLRKQARPRPQPVTRPGGQRVRPERPREIPQAGARVTAPSRLPGAPATPGIGSRVLSGVRRGVGSAVSRARGSVSTPAKRRGVGKFLLGSALIAGLVRGVDQDRDSTVGPRLATRSSSRAAGAAAERERRRLLGRGGRRSTIRTGPLGVTTRARVGVKTLLGA